MNPIEMTNNMARLKELISTMEVPELRKNIDFSNVHWLKRNLAIRNQSHQNFPEAIDIINSLIKGYNSILK